MRWGHSYLPDPSGPLCPGTQYIMVAVVPRPVTCVARGGPRHGRWCLMAMAMAVGEGNHGLCSIIHHQAQWSAGFQVPAATWQGHAEPSHHC